MLQEEFLCYTHPMDRFLKTDENPVSFLDHLESRGLIHDQTPNLRTYLESCRKDGTVPKVYCGFDPSAPSLQVGNLLPVLMLRRAQLHGVRPIVLLGGATGLIGDPSGKKEERVLLDSSVTEFNVDRIRKQLAGLIDLDDGKFGGLLRNNFTWFENFGYLDFLREVGKHITVNYMTAKDSVKIRMETGISYAEFGYMLIQGYDFLHLFEKDGCAIQMGGSDQWGNMTTGLELIRRKHGKEAHALSAPLLTDATGNKLGKSEKGTVFLDPEMTSPFAFYQFWLNQADADLPKLLRFLTLFTDKYILEIEDHIRKEPEKRMAQRVLAFELTQLIHGAESALGAENASKVLFSKDAAVLDHLSEKGLELLAREVPSTKLIQPLPTPIVDLLVTTGLATSKGEARRHLKGGAVSLNRVKVTDENHQVSSDAFGHRPFFLLGVGKSNLHLVLR